MTITNTTKARGSDGHAVSSAPGATAVQAFYAVLSAGDLPAVLAALGDDISWHEAAGTPFARTEPYRGALEVAEHVLGPIASAVPDLAVEIAQLIDLGTTVVVIGTYTGTARTTGDRMRVGYVHAWRTDGTRLVEFHQFTNADVFTSLLLDAASDIDSETNAG